MKDVDPMEFYSDILGSDPTPGDLGYKIPYVGRVGAPTELTNTNMFVVRIDTRIVHRMTSSNDMRSRSSLSLTATDQPLETHVTKRQLSKSGLRGIPTSTNIVTTEFASYMRSNMSSCFVFQPVLSEGQDDHESCDPQLVNMDKNGSDGRMNSPNRNRPASSTFSSDGVRIVLAENYHPAAL
ncbi:hypothetical protein A1F96_02260 [Pyrenophora tritici-repentis]|uniref:Saponin hydrolase n=1 Tax=Pyrenophora tritici-repentis TaxID=45151 RepID=A0A2W1E5V3_9PLEO|nr:Saponin hydrolase [Pyrenophora tritici-repentis]KAI1674195.1 Saponin hydrolase [Pyrenophora tritici-repentis]KAI1688702.1 Saponin hydrolase [Pyrenophora tritici-repentis]PWO27159.1 hypothetical protein PtrARCrB10_04284 [Pyrenophora tritici-repentis]PZD04521.1 hypothetical protein A1F95_00659 [Pyrenophora tritici-repentis]